MSWLWTDKMHRYHKFCPSFQKYPVTKLSGTCWHPTVFFTQNNTTSRFNQHVTNHNKMYNVLHTSILYWSFWLVCRLSSHYVGVPVDVHTLLYLCSPYANVAWYACVNRIPREFFSHGLISPESLSKHHFNIHCYLSGDSVNINITVYQLNCKSRPFLFSNCNHWYCHVLQPIILAFKFSIITFFYKGIHARPN